MNQYQQQQKEIKVHLKIMEDVTDKELNILIEGLKKIKGFNFSMSCFVLTKNN